MPRGGRRPGAGAPKGNTNAFRHGGHSLRAWKVLFAMREYPDKYALALRLQQAGFLDAYGRFDDRNLAAVIAYVHKEFFERPPSGDNQTQSPTPPPTGVGPSFPAAAPPPGTATPPPGPYRSFKMPALPRIRKPRAPRQRPKPQTPENPVRQSIPHNAAPATRSSADSDSLEHGQSPGQPDPNR